MQTSRTSRSIGAALVAVACGGCTILDDDEPPPIGTTGDTGGGECTAALQEIESCEYPLQWWFDHEGGGGNLVLVDDPAATVSIGPNAWLVMISSAADYIGTHAYDEGDCRAHCGWCEAGQLMCHGGLTESGMPRGCIMCFPFGIADVGEQCAAVQSACLEGGVEEDDGLDETGAGTTEYDCAAWRPEEDVQRDGGTVAVDAALIEEILLYQGEPLASCDDTRIRQRPDGYFEVSRLAEHGLLAMMGLARGDVFVAVDGQPMSNLDTVMQLAGRLTSAASFVVTVERAGEPFDVKVVIR